MTSQSAESAGEDRSLADPLLVVLAGLLIPYSLYVRGVPVGHDTPWHLPIFAAFHQQLTAGEIYPRWLTSMNHGLGSPLVFGYPPLPFWLASIVGLALAPFGVSSAAVVMGVSLACATAASGLAMWFCLDGIVRPPFRLLGALLYMLAPYHLLVDLYTRVAISEYWGFVFAPLLMYFARRAAAREKDGLAGLALSLAGMLLCHPFTALMFAGIPVVYTAVFARDRVRSILRLAAAYMLGAGIAAVYLVPGLAHQKWFSLARFNSNPLYRFDLHFLPIAAPIPDLPFARGLLMLLPVMLAVCLWGYWSCRSRQGGIPKGEPAFWMGTALAAACLMLVISKPVWLAIPLLQGIQFPWRFHTVLVLSASMLVALAFDRTLGAGVSRRAARQLALLLVAGGMLFTSIMGFSSRPIAERETAGLAAIRYDLFSAMWTQGELARVTSPGQMRELADRYPEAAFSEGEGEVSVIARAPREVRLRAHSAPGGWIRVRQAFYPAWVADPYAVRAGTSGLVEIHVPPGDEEIRLRLPYGRAEKAGLAISIASLLILLLGSVIGRPTRD